MSIHLERATRRPLPVYPSKTVCNERELADSDSERVAVVTMRAAVGRDMLALAADKGMCGDETDPDGWSVEFIREVAEYELAMSGTYRLWSDSHLIVKALDDPDPDIAARVRGIYRAVDRAYPGVTA